MVRINDLIATTRCLLIDLETYEVFEDLVIGTHCYARCLTERKPFVRRHRYPWNMRESILWVVPIGSQPTQKAG